MLAGDAAQAPEGRLIVHVITLEHQLLWCWKHGSEY